MKIGKWEISIERDVLTHDGFICVQRPKQGQMRVLDLFSGLGGFSQAFKDRGHEVITVDIESKFNPTICKDIMEFSISDLNGFEPDVILASPPCTEFSKSMMPDSWNKNRGVNPDTRLLEQTLRHIRDLTPRYWVVENVRGAIPFFEPLVGKPIKHVGSRYLWGRFPVIDVKPVYGKCCIPCTVENRAALRALIPYSLSMVLCRAMEGQISMIDVKCNDTAHGMMKEYNEWVFCPFCGEKLLS